MEKTNTGVAAAAFLIGIAILSTITVYPIIAQRIDDATLNNMALTSLGGILGVVASGGAWFMRGRTERQTGTGSGGTDATGAMTVIPPAGTSSVTTVETTAEPIRPPATPGPGTIVEERR